MVEKHLDNLISTQSEKEIEIFPTHAVVTLITAAIFFIFAVVVPILNLVGGLMWTATNTYFWNGVQVSAVFRTFEEMAGLVPILVDPDEGTIEFLRVPYGWIYGLLLLWRIPFLLLPLLGTILYIIPAIYKLAKKEPPSYELPIRIGTKIDKIDVFSTKFGMILALIGVGVQWLLYLLLLLNLPTPKPNINLLFVLICAISVLALVVGHSVWQWEKEWAWHLNFWTSKTVFYSFVVGVLIFCTFPFLYAFVQSFQDPSYTAGTVEYFPSRPGIDNYDLIFGVFQFQTFIINSFITAITTTILCVAIGAFGGYVLAQFRFKLKTIILGAILSMTMFPGIVILVPLIQQYIFLREAFDINWLINQPPITGTIQFFSFLALGISVIILVVIWIIKIYQKNFQIFKTYLEIGLGLVIGVSAIVFVLSFILGGFLVETFPINLLLLAFLTLMLALVYSGVNLILQWYQNKEINVKYLILFIVSIIFSIVTLLLPWLLTPNFYDSVTVPLVHPQIGLLIPYIAFNLPLTLFLLYNFFQEIPSELVKAARVDGASNFQVFWQVIFPLAIPGVFTTAILVFIAAWNEFLFAQNLLVTTEEWTIPVAMSLFSGIPVSGGEVYNNFLLLNAATVIVTLPLIILVLIFQKQIIAGITAGAVKG